MDCALFLASALETAKVIFGNRNTTETVLLDACETQASEGIPCLLAQMAVT